MTRPTRALTRVRSRSGGGARITPELIAEVRERRRLARLTEVDFTEAAERFRRVVSGRYRPRNVTFPTPGVGGWSVNLFDDAILINARDEEQAARLVLGLGDGILGKIIELSIQGKPEFSGPVLDLRGVGIIKGMELSKRLWNVVSPGEPLPGKLTPAFRVILPDNLASLLRREGLDRFYEFSDRLIRMFDGAELDQIGRILQELIALQHEVTTFIGVFRMVALHNLEGVGENIGAVIHDFNGMYSILRGYLGLYIEYLRVDKLDEIDLNGMRQLASLP